MEEVTNQEMQLRTSPSLGNLGKALSLAQAEYPTVAKNKTATVQMKAGGRYSYRYADIADVIAAVAPVNAKHGLCFFQIPQTKNNQHQLVSTVLHESGEFIEGILDLEPADRSPQSLGSAITYARRYALSAMLGVVSEEDEDGKLATQGSTNGNATSTRSKNTKAVQAATASNQEASTPATELSFIFSSAGITDTTEQKMMVAAAMEDLGIEIEDPKKPPLLRTLDPEMAGHVVAQVKLNLTPKEEA